MSARNLPGRVAELLADEGDMVTAGQVLARMDTRDLEASLGQSRAQVPPGQEALQAARADLDLQASRCGSPARSWTGRSSCRERLRQQADPRSAASQLERRRPPTPRGGRIQRWPSMCSRAPGATSNCCGSTSPTTHWSPRATAGAISPRQHRRGAAGRRQGVHHARHQRSSTWTSSCPPRRRARVGSAPRRASCWTRCRDYVIPATVSFVAAEAQFTPKAVETAQRARQADVPRQGAHRSRPAAAHAPRCGPACRAWPMSATRTPAAGWPAACSGEPAAMSAVDRRGRATSTASSHRYGRVAALDGGRRSRSRPAAWSG